MLRIQELLCFKIANNQTQLSGPSSRLLTKIDIGINMINSNLLIFFEFFLVSEKIEKLKAFWRVATIFHRGKMTF